ncbi:MAG: hypothetical protein RLZZ175_2787 [Bacteroidota bacterium]|jgi:hypothetical protein
MQVHNHNSKDYYPIKFDKVIANEAENGLKIIKHEDNQTPAIHKNGSLLPHITEVHTPGTGVMQVTRETRMLLDMMQNSPRIATLKSEVHFEMFAMKLVDIMYRDTNQKIPAESDRELLGERIAAKIKIHFMMLTFKELEYATESAITGDFGVWMGISVANWVNAIRAYLNSKFRIEAKMIQATIERDMQLAEAKAQHLAQMNKIEFKHELQLQHDYESMIAIAQDIQNCLANDEAYAYNLELLYNFFENCRLVEFTTPQKIEAFKNAFSIKKNEIMLQTNIAIKHRNDKIATYEFAKKGSTEHDELSMKAKIALVKKYLKELTISQLQVHNCFTIYNFYNFHNFKNVNS